MEYRTEYGRMIAGDCKEILTGGSIILSGKVDLIFTSPPFPLNRAKSYGNIEQSSNSLEKYGIMKPADLEQIYPVSM